MRAGRLEPILEAVREAAQRRARRRSLADLRTVLDPAFDGGRRFCAALARPGLALIAECKRRSPSAGVLRDERHLGERARAYREGGAAALSILTEESAFGGSLEDFDALAGAGLPRLRKDFLLDEWMVLESAAHGAEAVLLLACVLPDPLLGELRAAAGEAGMAVLVEVHDEAELERAVAVRPDALGVNARDLRSFEVDPSIVLGLLPQIPPGPLRVAESGLRSLADLQAVQAAGADAALVGSALMQAPDPRALLRSWTSALAPEARR